MSNKKIEILERALAREKKARKEAEKILEDKARDLYLLTGQLKESNNTLESLLAKKNLELKGVFKNIIDAYCIIDMYGNVLEMNDATFELLGCKNKKEGINLSKFVFEDDTKLVRDAFNELKEKGDFKDLKVRIVSKNNTIKHLHINAGLITDHKGKPIAIQGTARDITQEHKVQNNLIKSENRLKTLILNLDSGILLEDEDCNIIFTNKKFCDLFSIRENPEQLQGQHCSTRMGSSKTLFEKPEAFIARMQDVVNNKTKVLGDELNMLDGKILQRDYIPIYEGNTYKGHLWTFKDVTAEKQAQQNLIESENNLKTLVQNLDHGIYLEDKNGIAVLANKKLCEQFYMPLSPDLIPGQDFSNGAEESKALFLEPEKFYKRYKEIIKNRKIVIGDELKMVDGKVLERNYIPIFKNNTFKGHLWSFNDVTLRRQYNEDIEAQKQKYSNIIANMNLGLIEVDNDNNILMVNQSFMNLTAYSEEELIGKSAIEILVPEENQEAVKEIANKTKLGNSDSNEIQIKNKKGEIKSILVSSAPNYNLNKQVTGSIGVILDITEIKNLENQKEILLRNLEKSNNELQEYAHIVSHDLKSPLRSIFALISWIKEDNLESLDSSSINNIELIEGTLEKMEGLISDILNYSSVTSDSVDDRPVDLNSVIDDLKQILFIPEHISIDVKNKLPIITGDKTRLQQLFQNLLSNAINYIDKDIGLITINVKELSNHYKFSVKDNGIGIDKKYHDKIFKIFHSLNDSKESSGIGLSIVKKIVDLYNGKIWVESTPEIGTTFYFTLKKQ